MPKFLTTMAYNYHSEQNYLYTRLVVFKSFIY